MTTAIIGVGSIGSTIARHLVHADETVAAAVRIEMPGGDLHQYGSNGEVLDLDEARTAIGSKEVPA